MKNFYTLAMGIAMMTAAVSASAEGIHVGYSDGKYNPDGLGKNGSNATISAAVRITPEMLAPYASCQITSMAVALADNNSYPEEITGWLRSDKAGENIYSASVAAAGGWLTLQFDAPINVTEFTESGVWAGFDYVQPKKLNILAIGGEPNIPDACWTAKNGAWTDFKAYGVLPIELVVEGEGLPQHDLAIKNAAIKPNIVKLGGLMNVSGTIKNNALQSATDPCVKISFDDNVYTETIEATLGYRDEVNFDLALQLDPNDTQEREADIKVEVLWSDDTIDDFSADNETVVPVSFVKEVFFRKMVVEEGTGAWCGWCVRGLVGMKEMREQYPDQFLGIGVHNGDVYKVSAYDSWMSTKISGYPSCLINRDGKVYDPSFGQLESYLNSMNVIATMGVGIEAKYEEGMMTLTGTVTPMISQDDADYNIAYVLIEDQLPISQANYYSGGGNGQMGGFENLPNPCNVDIDDVARDIYPKPAGYSDCIPAQITKGTPITHEVTVELPESKYSNADNLSVAILLINNKTGEVVNGEKTSQIEGLNWTRPIAIEEVREEAASAVVYNLNGQRVNAQSGLNIVNGKVVYFAK